jgi:hypothetical protein
MMDGQLDLDGGEAIDPRITKAAKMLWYRDAKRTWAIDGNDVARERAIALWPRVEKHYVDAARVALEAAGAL